MTLRIEGRYAKCHDYLNIMLSVVGLNVVMLSVVGPFRHHLSTLVPCSLTLSLQNGTE
jgi:hypothetical protein